MLPKIAFGWVLLLSVLLLHLPRESDGKDILFFFGMSTYSHRITAWPLAVKLVAEGHSVTFLQAVKNKNPHPNITEMKPDNVQHMILPNFVEMRENMGKPLAYLLTWYLPQSGVTVCQQFLDSQKNIDWVNSKKFDLVVIDALFNDCAYGLAYKWNAKTIIFSTTHPFEWFADTFGFPDESGSAPSIHFSSEMPLAFLDRVKAALSYLYFYCSREFRCLDQINGMLREKLKMPEMPSVRDLAMNTSLLLLNSYFSEELPRSLPPFVIPIGGMHVSGEVKPLPKEMEDFVKDAGQGFIYVSFGSEADLTKVSSHIIETFYTVMGKSKAKFLWRWNGARPEKMPKNVFSASWMPQQDALGHPKCKGFITHGGLLSMQEAVYHGVPMVVFPIFAEQDYNAERLHRTGRGVRLELGTLTESQLENAVQRLLTDASLQEQMKLASIRFKDRREKPVDTAMWWVNYVFRHNDLSFLRPIGISQYWYERRQLDVWAFIGTISFLFLYTVTKVLKKVLGLCFGGKKKRSSPASTVVQGKKRN